VNNLTEVSKDDRSDQSKHNKAPKKVVKIGRSTRSQDNPKWNASRPDKYDTSSFLTVCASTKTSKSALSLPTVPSLPFKKIPSQVLEKEKLWTMIWAILIPI
jgi:hypothetical protein